MLGFTTTTWQVPGSMGFAGSKHETKHHLWNSNLIDCCSHYPAESLKLLRAWAWERVRETQRGSVVGEAGVEAGKRYGAHGAQQCKVLEVLCNSAAPESLTDREQGEKKNPTPKETPTGVYPLLLQLHQNSVKTSSLHCLEIWLEGYFQWW